MKSEFLQKLNESYYKTLILDVDGVIFDSNKIKENNIYLAVKRLAGKETAEKFTPWFINLSGIPREVKINNYFNKQPVLANRILAYYNELNNQSLYSVEPTAGAIQFIQKWQERITIMALSGGAQNEIEKLFGLHNITSGFKYIFGGPESKEQNLRQVSVKHPIIYIGDSMVDFETAQKIGADFIFMHGYTSFADWKSEFKYKEQVKVIKNLKELI